MSYQRVIPRDLFNEANLLKCFGTLYLRLETLAIEGVSLEHDDEAFDIDQDENTGGLYIRNVALIVRGQRMGMWRPLNSRHAWPLYLNTPDDEEYSVFDDEGNLSAEMLNFLQSPPPQKGKHEDRHNRP